MGFKDNGDGTITDLTAGLMWQKENDDTQRNWREALEYANTLSLGDHSDWRLPSKEELSSLWKTVGENFEFNRRRYFSSRRLLWSSTTRLGSPAPAWVLNFYDGGSGYHQMDAFVHCVRLGSDKGRNEMRVGGGWTVWGPPEFGTLVQPRKSTDGPPLFVDNRDGTISDRASKLMWQGSDDGSGKTWFETDKYVKMLSLADYSDWRLPTLEELAGLWETRDAFFARTTPFSHSYWSSTTRANGYIRWYVSFKNGLVNCVSQSDHEFHVRCVRVIQPSDRRSAR
jgi:hypothetical protein